MGWFPQYYKISFRINKQNAATNFLYIFYHINRAVECLVSEARLGTNLFVPEEVDGLDRRYGKRTSKYH